MLEQGPWTGMVSVFSQDLVGMVPLAPGVLLRGSEVVPPSATPVGGQQDTGTIEYLAFGVRAGSRSAPLSLVGEGTPEATPVSEVEPMPARVEVRIRYSEPTLAEREVKEIPTRWESASSMLTGQPYADLMTLEDARVSEKDEHVAAIDFTASMPNVWMRMIHTMDLLPFLPTEG